MFYIVFGESVINDAVAVVLFGTFARFVGAPTIVYTVPIFIAIGDFFFVFFGSIMLGYVIGVFAGICSKCVDDAAIRFNAIAGIVWNVRPAVDRIDDSCFVSSAVNVAVPDASVNEASRNHTSLVVCR